MFSDESDGNVPDHSGIHKKLFPYLVNLFSYDLCMLPECCRNWQKYFPSPPPLQCLRIYKDCKWFVISTARFVEVKLWLLLLQIYF